MVEDDLEALDAEVAEALEEEIPGVFEVELKALEVEEAIALEEEELEALDAEQVAEETLEETSVELTRVERGDELAGIDEDIKEKVLEALAAEELWMAVDSVERVLEDCDCEDVVSGCWLEESVDVLSGVRLEDSAGAVLLTTSKVEVLVTAFVDEETT